MLESDVYAAIGEEGFTRLVAAFYKQIPSDEVLGPMYKSTDLPGAEKRLRDFLIFRFGGPPVYIEERGHPRLRMRHSPFAVNEAAKSHWLQIMSNALNQADLEFEAASVLRNFFDSTADFLINRPG